MSGNIGGVCSPTQVAIAIERGRQLLPGAHGTVPFPDGSVLTVLRDLDGRCGV
jgi:hypothetical protein